MNDFRTVKIFSNGISTFTNLGTSRIKNPNLSTQKRGKIQEFSYASRRRLRRFLIENIGDGNCYGITCTIPSCEFSAERWRRLLKRFFMRVSRLGFGLVYRVELQQNGMPHLHCVSYYKTIEDCWNVQVQWWESLEEEIYEDEDFGTINLLQRQGSLIHSCILSSPRSDFYRWFRYLCSHACKVKQVQLGYQGKQWGIVNRNCFKPCDFIDYDLSDKEFYTLLRWIRKLTKCRTKRFLYGRSDLFVNPQTIKQMIKYIISETNDVF